MQREKALQNNNVSDYDFNDVYYLIIPGISTWESLVQFHMEVLGWDLRDIYSFYSEYQTSRTQYLFQDGPCSANYDTNYTVKKVNNKLNTTSCCRVLFGPLDFLYRESCVTLCH